MTKNEVIELADKIVLGIATDDEINLYARICALAENTSNETLSISAEDKAALEDEIRAEIFRKTTPVKVHRIAWAKWVAVAASVIMIIGLSWVLFNKKDQEVAQQPVKKTDSAAYTVRHQLNNTGADRKIALPDGSLVILANNSIITYKEPFGAAREILLSGKAHFKVAKDKSRPFIVSSGDISTTALGTEFTVTAFEQSKQISVRLYEGKVVIKPVNKQNLKMKQDVYLVPGQEFIYGSNGILVRSFKPKEVAAKAKPTDDVQPDSLSIPEDLSAPYFMFNNQSLDQVFDNLSALYNVKIVYQKKDVQNIAFTGKYEQTKSLESILELIGKLNKLTITKTDSAYIVSK